MSTELNFDFNNAEVSTFESKYLEPGPQLVKVTEVKSGLSSQKQSPYIEFTVANDKGLTCSHQYYLNTVKGPSGKSAMDITSAQLVILVAAVIGVDIMTDEGKKAAKAKIGEVKTVEALVNQIASICVGKTFAIRLIGNIINSTDMTKKDWIKSEFASGTFAVPTNKLSTLKPYDPTNPKDLKGIPSSISSTPIKGVSGDMNWGNS